MKPVFFTFVLLLVSSLSFSQARAKDIKDDPIVKERMNNGGVRVKADIKVSEYFGLEEKIQAIMLNDVIPVECPKSIGYSDKSLYLKALNTWIKENPSKLKEDKKNSLISE